MGCLFFFPFRNHLSIVYFVPGTMITYAWGLALIFTATVRGSTSYSLQTSNTHARAHTHTRTHTCTHLKGPSVQDQVPRWHCWEVVEPIKYGVQMEGLQVTGDVLLKGAAGPSVFFSAFSSHFSSLTLTPPAPTSTSGLRTARPSNHRLELSNPRAKQPFSFYQLTTLRQFLQCLEDSTHKEHHQSKNTHFINGNNKGWAQLF